MYSISKIYWVEGLCPNSLWYNCAKIILKTIKQGVQPLMLKESFVPVS